MTAVLVVVAAGFLGMQLLILALNLATFPVLRTEPSGGPGRAAGVSILIPARNEARNLPETLPRVLAQPGADEVIVLDDASSDGTAALLQEFAAREPRLQVIAGRALPPGWSGKNWACQQLAEAAAGEILIFTDADVIWEAGTLEALLASRRAAHADLLTVWPRQRTGSLAERSVVPLIDLLLLSWLPYPAVRRLSPASLAAGNGQLMLWTREAYGSVGGHRAVAAEVLEDVRMAQLAKGRGLRLELALGGRLLGARMYRGGNEVTAGFAKNALAAHGGSRPALAASLALQTLAYLLPWALLPTEPLWLLPAALGLGQRALVCLKCRRSPWEALLQPLAVPFMWRIGLRALLASGYRWKGRSYP